MSAVERREALRLSARAVLLDIEGTTTPLAFVKEVLFPYARARLPEFVAANHQDPAVAEQLGLINEIAGAELTLDRAGRFLRAWIDQDQKVSPLKVLQGMVWREGYESGEIKGQVYADAVEALAKWRSAGVPLYIYSSGSVEAQKLLFAHSEHGDLSGWFAGHFDLAVGGKKEPESYAAIARRIGLAPSDILFVSDVEAELNAAREAGMRTVWMVREGAMPAPASHETARDFSSPALS